VSGLVIRSLTDLETMRRLGMECGLEDAGRDDETILAAWGAYDGDDLIGTIALEKLGELDTANWLAVDEAYRRRGVAAGLYALLEREARARGISRLWVTARAPAFFVAQGYESVPPSTERDLLLGGCLECDQYGRDCEPRALSKGLEGPAQTGP
jgi:N-acetylglutamate synthase-like GNAT family acetyltransferase